MITMTVKELITKLLDYGMDEPVYINLGASMMPKGSGKIIDISAHDANITCGFGVYITTREDLFAIDA